MSPETSTVSRGKLRPFSEYLKEAMSPETYEWVLSLGRKQLGPESTESGDD